jgi:hypothetical protein
LQPWWHTVLDLTRRARRSSHAREAPTGGHLKDHQKPRSSVHPCQRKHPTETADKPLKSSKRRTQGRSRPTRCQLPTTTTERNCQKVGADSFARSLAHSPRNFDDSA